MRKPQASNGEISVTGERTERTRWAEHGSHLGREDALISCRDDGSISNQGEHGRRNRWYAGRVGAADAGPLRAGEVGVASHRHARKRRRERRSGLRVTGSINGLREAKG